MENTKLELPDFVVRMIKEYQELNERIVKGHQIFTLPNIIKDGTHDLTRQLEHMVKYREILGERIDNTLWAIVHKTFPDSVKWEAQKIENLIVEAIHEYI